MGSLGDGGRWGTRVASQGFGVLGGVVGMWLCFQKAREAGGKGPEGPLGSPGYLKSREQIILRAPALPRLPTQDPQKRKGALPSMGFTHMVPPALGAKPSSQSCHLATWGQYSHTMQGHLP